MTAFEIGLCSFVALVMLIYMGFHIAIVLFLVGLGGTWLLRGDIDIAGRMIALAVTDSIAEYEFGTIPLFVIMGLFITISGLGRDSYLVANSAFRRVPGRLGHATVGANAIFAAITGVSIASASLFAKIAVPEMLKRGYSPALATGIVAGSSMLGMLIPPSILLIVYAFLTDRSVSDMYAAALIPGLLLTFAFSATIFLIAWVRPGAVGEPADRSNEERLGLRRVFVLVFPIALLIALVLGGIYGGIFTATEAGAVGAAGGLVIALMRRSLDWPTFRRMVLETGYITASLILIVAGAMVFTRFLAMTGLPTTMVAWVVENQFSVASVMAIYVVLILLLGTTLDSSSILMIVVPVFAPVLEQLGADLVSVGVVTVLAIEVGLITPPMGMSVFVVKAALESDPDTATISLKDIFVGSAPFVIASVFVIALLLMFPTLTSTGWVR